MIKPFQHEAEQYKALIQDLLAKAKKAGAHQAEAAINNELGFTVNVRMGEVETVEQHRSKGLSLTVFFDKRMGSTSTSDLSPDAIQYALDKACSIARFTDIDEYSGLADAHLMAYDYPDLALHYPWHINPESAAKMALECEDVARNTHKLITNSEGVSLTTSEYFHVLGNSHGFMGHYPSSCHSMSCVLIANDGHAMERDYDYTVARDPSALENTSQLAKKAVDRTIMRLGARKLSTRQAPVIFAADCAKSLLKHFVSAIAGGNLYRKSSFLLDQLDHAIFPKHIRIDERPHLPKGMGSAPYDGDGVATKARDIISEGVLRGYVLDSYSARKLGMQTTGNAGGVHNLFISAGNENLEGLLHKMGTGLLVTELLGQGVNIVTGDYSRGAFGYWVEDGKIQHPVHEIVIAGNLKDMFLNLVETANDVDHRSNIHTGSILLEKMTIAGH